MKNILKIITAPLLALLLVACDDDSSNSKSHLPPQNQNIVEVAQSNGSFSTLVTALQATGLDATLADANSKFTVFAPTDAAFAKLGQNTINALLSDPQTLSDILLYHVVADNVINASAAVAAAGSTLTTANKDDIGVGLKGSDLFVNASKVILPDVGASNGIIHAIDTVLIPTADNSASGNIAEVASAAGRFNTLVNALVSTGLDTVLADDSKRFTVFAPTDAAFKALGDISSLTKDQLRDILLYHVVADKEISSGAFAAITGSRLTMANGDSASASAQSTGLFIDQSRIVSPDVDASNGIIHAIDKVLTPPS